MITSGSKAIPTCMDVGVAKTVFTVNIRQDLGMPEGLNLEKVSTTEWWNRTAIHEKIKAHGMHSHIPSSNF